MDTGTVDLRRLSLRSAQFQTALVELVRLTRVPCGLPVPSAALQGPPRDILEWLGYVFGFQGDNVRNQREHLVLHLANLHMRHSHMGAADTLDQYVVRSFREKLLENYEEWCSYLGVRSSVQVSVSPVDIDLVIRQELLYISLYLFIWGESANLRFLPECLCYIFHHMAMELNGILDGHLDSMPDYSGENSFLNCVVKPIYKTILSEIKNSKNGIAPYSKWRNYDDFNEYFWSRRCFKELNWPLNLESEFFKGAGKTGFVERRSYWNVFSSFYRLWLMLILFLQGAIILCWEEGYSHPWQALSNRGVKVRLLSLLVTWSGMEFFKSVLHMVMQYSLVRPENPSVGVRMIVSNLISGSWAISLGWLYVQIWLKKWEDGSLLPETSKWEEKFLIAAIPFLLLKLLPFVMSFMSLNFNLFNKKNHRTCDLLTNQIYVGRGLRESLFDSMKYSMFWGVILLVKFSFSYLEQIQPSVKMTKQLLNLHSAENHGYNNVFTKGNGLSIGLIWLPTVLIYLMDLQIWYTLCSFLVGVTVGLFSRLGVIQNIIQLRHRFHQFVWQVVCKFNFIPKECSSQGTGNNGWVNLRNWTNPQFVKGISDHVMVGKFALMWNEIVTAFREEDIISDNEFELLVFPSDSWKVGVVMWPCFLLSNNIILAVGEIQKFADAPDDWVHRKIFKEEFTRCAIIEAYDSVKNLLLERIMDPQTEEHSLVKSCFQHVEYCVGLGKFTKVFNMEKLQQIYTAVVGVVESLIIAERDLYQVVNALQILYHVFVHEFIREEGTDIQGLRRDGLAPHCCNSMLFHNAVNLPDSSNVNFAQQIQRLYTILTTRDSMENIPANDEARCRITFFCNSLFMGIPKSPPLEKMKAFSVLTPYYKESVLYSEEELKSQNEDGISILYYLQTVYNDDWKNFMERMRREGMEDDNDIWTIKLRDLRLWASYRGQTLARTVRGMMHYGRAIQLLSFLESLPFTGSRGAEVMPAEESVFVGNHRQDIARMKFTYLVTCQNYGHDKETMDPRADDIRYLMEEYDALLVAYVDEVWEKDEHYSVLTRYDQALQKEVEVYRIKLPGPFKLGCGKPENQNHAIIFTRGDALQTIDMNQDNYFEEALKMGSLLEEFDACYGIRKPTIAGVREHIFTASVSSLAWFMSAQETGFVTSGQRVLANPLKVRMHYGHPDVFDRIWILTRGGVSKASRMINICEDIFAGFNCTSRGGNITHHEYLQIGKGRDVGLNQISMFEAKIAGGSAEQLLSRDVHRLGNKLDFFRMLSFYHSTVGFYLSNVMVIWTMYTLFWGDLYMALSGAENFRMGLHSNDIRAVLEIQFLQLVLMTGCPMIVDGSVERGIFSALCDFFISQLQLSSLFYTFSMGTRAHFFGRTILHGGAKYRETGRGFVVMHQGFASNYRLYARSHFIKAIELTMVLTLYSLFSPLSKATFFFIDTSITGWLLVFSWIFSPFIFNPSGFDWLKTVNDFDEFLKWIWCSAGVFSKAEESWERWWYEEQSHLWKTGFCSKLLEIVLVSRFFFFQYGIVCQIQITSRNRSLMVYLLSWGLVAAVFAMHVINSNAHKRYAMKRHIYYRLFQAIVITLSILGISALFKFTNITFRDLFFLQLSVVPTGWGLVLIAQILRHYLERSSLWDIVVTVARLYDLLFGVIVMAPVAILSWLPGFNSMQIRILFNAAFGRGLHISQMLSGRIPNSHSLHKTR